MSAFQCPQCGYRQERRRPGPPRFLCFGEVVALIEASTTTTLDGVATQLGVTREAIRLALERDGYSYSALVAERRAVAADVRACRKIVNSRPLAPCGTRAAYVRHRRRGEEPCVPCLDATAAEAREVQTRLRDERRPNRRRDSEETKAKKRAALRRHHRGEAA
jgi:hypothetical protein